jgi:DNA replication licensing factor MCM3
MATAAPVSDAQLHEREEWEGKVRMFSNFLHSNREEWKNRITAELANDRFRIPLDLRDLEKEEAGLSLRFLNHPVKWLLPWEEALLAFLRDMDEKAVRRLKQPLKLDVSGAFGRRHVTPRGVTAQSLQNMMCVEGIVVKAGLKQPKLLQSIHVTKNGDEARVESRDHRDQTAFVNSTRAGAMPTHDAEGRELALEIGLSVYKDSQKFTIMETPEQAPCGQIPRSVEIICEGDLADKAKPGERVQVIGIYKSFPKQETDFTRGQWPARLIATSITAIKEMVESPFLLDDVRAINQIAQREDSFDLLARSLAPSICGHALPKKGLLLQMIGGTERNLPNGTHLRGDINVLMIGDPSCGKSQMLRFVMNTAPLAISTTGRGSSGVGLTAAITKEPGSREFQLEAGAMVLADRGFICIDEFDKMGQNDRVAIHEAMEQQCVTIAKAGMHVTLNARCSVVAAANPVYGSFDPAMDLAKNIGMPDSLLSRFDLVFVVRDVTTEETDRKIASQVIRQAQLRLGMDDGRRRGVEQVHSSILQRRQESDRQREQEATEVFEKRAQSAEGDERPEVVTVDFLRKYLRYCRRFTPILSEEAQQEVADRYVDMRMRFQSGYAEQFDGANPESKKPRLAVTTRTLEALIRLSTAHAKLKLRKEEVLKEDVIEAYKLMLGAREEEPTQSFQAPAPPAPPGSGPAPDAESHEPQAKRRKQESAAEVSKARVESLQKIAAQVFAAQRITEILRGDLFEQVNARLMGGEEPFSEMEFEKALAVMEAKNKVFVNPESGDVTLLD